MPKKIEENSIQEEPCHKFKRNDCGLIEGVKYVYNEDNTVNWRAMVKPEYLVVNRQYKEQLTGKDINHIEDKYLLILLAGLKELAQIRGYSKVTYKALNATQDYVGVACEIEWIPNYETGMNPVVFSSLADASSDNTFDFARNYLAAIAENRAFVRCVRNYLGIHVVSHEEIGPNKKEREESVSTETNKPHGLLQKKLEERGKSFETLKAQYIKLGHAEAAEWNVITDIPLNDLWAILEMMKKKEK